MVELDRRKLGKFLRRKINEDLGTGTVDVAQMPGEDVKAVARYSTQSLALDFALGGGFPVGLISLLYGGESSGKTSTILRTIADAQRRCANCLRYVDEIRVEEIIDEDTGEVDYVTHGTCDCYATGVFVPRQASDEKKDAFVARCKGYQDNSFEPTYVLYMDAENTLDKLWAQALGVDLRRLEHAVATNAEEAIDVYCQYVESGYVDLAILDSIAVLTPSKETESSAAEWQQGLGARLVNKFVRRAGAAAVRVRRMRGRSPTQIWVNQTRQKIGQMYGEGVTLPYGKAQLFAAAVIAKFWGTQDKKKQLRGMFNELNANEKMSIAEAVYQHFKIDKNKTGPAKGEGQFEVIVSGPRKGEINEFGYVMHHAQRFGILQKDGAKWRLGEAEYTRQKDALDAASDPLVLAKIRQRVLTLMNEELDRG